MSASNSTFGERGPDHGAKKNFSPGIPLANWPLGQSGLLGGTAVPGYARTSLGYAPAGATSIVRYSNPYGPPNIYSYPFRYGNDGGTSELAFAHNSHAFGFTPINGGTSLPGSGQNSTASFGFTPINGGTSVPAFGQNSSTTLGSASIFCGTSMPAFGQNGATVGSFPGNGCTSVPHTFCGTSMPAFGQNSASATFGSFTGNGGTSLPAYGQNSSTSLGSAPAFGGTSMSAFGQNGGGISMPTFSTPFGCAPANGGTSVPPTFGRSINSFGFTPRNTITSVPAWQHSNPLGPITTNDGTPVTMFGEGRSYFPPTPTDGATFVSAPTNGATLCGAPLSSTLTQAARASPICSFSSGTTSCLQTPAVNPSNSPGFSFGCTVPCNQLTLSSGTSSLFGTDPSLFGTQNQLSGITTHFQTPTINASSSPGFGFGCTTYGQTTTQFGTIGNLNETSSCSDEVQSPISGCQVKTPSSEDSSFRPLTFRISRGGSRVTPYTETVELEPDSRKSTRFMSISAMPVFRDKCHEELRWEDKQFGDNGLLVNKPVDVSGNVPLFHSVISGQSAIGSQCTGSKVKPYSKTLVGVDGRRATSISAMPVCLDKSHEKLRSEDHQFNNAGGGVDPDIAQLNCFSNPVSRTGSSFQNAMPFSVPPSIAASPSRCRAERPPAVPQMSFEVPKTTSVRYGISSIPVAFSTDANEAPTARTKLPLLPKDNSGILISGPSEQWNLKIDFENKCHIKHTYIHVYENGKVSVELSKPHVDGSMYQDKVGNPGETFAAAHSLGTNSVNGNYPSEKEVSSNAYWLMPKLKDSDYFIEPRVEELAIKESFEPGFCSHVKDFVVGHQRYGRIKFLGETDVRQLDVNSHIVFRNREVILSMDESKKPPVGHGLNRAAEITLCDIKCVDKAGNQLINGPRVEKYKKKLMKKAAEQGAEFVSYDPVQGEWKFRVEHF